MNIANLLVSCSTFTPLVAPKCPDSQNPQEPLIHQRIQETTPIYSYLSKTVAHRLISI